MSKDTESERLARVEEQVKWMAPRVERIENKLDLLIEKSAVRWGKILGAVIVISYLVKSIF